MEKPHTWNHYLPWAEFSTHLQTTPFKVAYGRDPPSISPFVHGETRIDEHEEQLLNRDAMLKVLKDNLLKAQTRKNQQVNSHRSNVTFQFRDSILLRV